jgi:hypothetical protein
MRTRRPLDRRLLALELAVLSSCFLLPGCPLSDDYYIDPDLAGTGGGSGASTLSGGKGGALGGAGGCPDCPAGCHFEERPGSRYLICPIDRTYAEAEATCAEAGMTLAMIDDAPENDWIWNAVRRSYRGVQPFVLMGASDRESEGDWRFADGRPFWSGGASGDEVGGEYVNWDAAQPNDRSPVTTTEEDCGAITLSNGKWNDVRCELDCPFVCESR